MHPEAREHRGQFSMQVSLGNDEMQSPSDLAKAMRKVAHEVQNGEISGNVRDDNGNTVGSWSLSMQEVCTICGEAHSF